MNRDRNAHRPTRAAKHERNLAGIDADAITSMVAAGRPNPFVAGSRENIAYGWTKELLRHAQSDKPTELAAQARRIFPKAGTRRAVGAATGTAPTETAAPVPPVPDRNPERSLAVSTPAAVPPLPLMKPRVPIKDLWDQDKLFPVSQKFADQIAKAEKSINDWTQENSVTGALGRYQITKTSQFDIGLLDENRQWLGGPYPDYQRFVDSPGLQNLAFAAYLNKTWHYLKSKGVLSYAGQQVEGIERPFTVTQAGLMAAAHAEGAGAVSMYFKHLAENNWISDLDTFPEGKIPGIGRKLGDAFEKIDERLTMFEDVPLYASPAVPALNDPGIFE